MVDDNDARNRSSRINISRSHHGAAHAQLWGRLNPGLGDAALSTNRTDDHFEGLCEELDMLTAVKQSVHRMTSHLQLISSYLEMMDYTKALGRTKETIKEMHALEASLSGLANVGMTVPENGAVVVPHGSTVVSHEDVNVDVDSKEVRAVDKNEIRAGCGNDNPKTK